MEVQWCMLKALIWMEIKWPRYQMVFRTCRIYEEEFKLLKMEWWKRKGIFPQIRSVKSGSGNEILTKDIILDQISECSAYGISRRDAIEADGQMLELWETTDQDASIDLMI
ncbi:unnamed protein product [Prunus armeniaca]|uniref:Uncharacterized protein n=1 Tax=Prunus armeniaca TaxID=36596 RepID=A0A6J5WLU6_PRUAR|nr:unnamed protein product [Prunus armeniaca]